MCCEKCEYQVDVYQQGLLNETYFCQFTFISVELCFLCPLRHAVNCPSTLILQIHILSTLLCLADKKKQTPHILISESVISFQTDLKGVAFYETWLKMNEGAVGLCE